MSASPTVFILQSRKLQGRRFDSEYHYALLNIRIKSPYPLVKLFSLATFKTGGTPSTDNEEYWGGTLPWVSAKDFKNFRFEDAEDHITELAAQEATTYVVNKPAVLMVSRSGILQHSLPVMVTHKRTAINQDIKAFFPDKRVSADYLGAFFDLSGKRLLPLLCKSGATVQSLNTNELLNLPIPVPPHEVQKQIVAELDAAYEAKRNADEKASRLLASIDEVIFSELGIPPLPPQDTSIRARMFIVPTQKLVNCRLDASFYKQDYVRFDRVLSESPHRVGTVSEFEIDVFQGNSRNLNEKDGINLLKVKNIQKDGTIDYEDVEPVSDVPCAKRLVKGDIIAPFIGAAILNFKFGLFNGGKDGKYAVDNNTGVFRILSHDLSSEYLWLYFQSALTKIQLERLVGGGGVPYLGTDNARQIKVIVPSTSVQLRIIKRVTAIREEAKRLQSYAAEALASAKSHLENQLL